MEADSNELDLREQFVRDYRRLEQSFRNRPEVVVPPPPPSGEDSTALQLELEDAKKKLETAQRQSTELERQLAEQAKKCKTAEDRVRAAENCAKEVEQQVLAVRTQLEQGQQCYAADIARLNEKIQRREKTVRELQQLAKGLQQRAKEKHPDVSVKVLRDRIKELTQTNEEWQSKYTETRRRLLELQKTTKRT